MKDPSEIIAVPEPTGDEFFFGELERMLTGYRETLIFREAFSSGVFDITEETVSSELVAEKLSYDKCMCQLLCEALAGMGMLAKDGDRFRNSPMASLYFVKSSPYYQGCNVKLALSKIAYWESFGSIMREGPVLVSTDSMFGDLWISAIGEGAKSGSIGKVLGYLESRIDMGSLRSMIDVGGGHGLYTIGFCGKYSGMSGTVFDRGRIIDVAERNIRDYGVPVSVIRGDYTADPLGGPYDLVFSSFNGSCSDRSMATRMAEAVSEGGYLVARRHLPSRSKDAVANLDWNLSVSDRAMKGVPRHGGHMSDYPGFDEELCSLGFTIVSSEEFDTTSYITIFRRNQGIR